MALLPFPRLVNLHEEKHSALLCFFQASSGFCASGASAYTSCKLRSKPNAQGKPPRNFYCCLFNIRNDCSCVKVLLRFIRCCYLLKTCRLKRIAREIFPQKIIDYTLSVMMNRYIVNWQILYVGINGCYFNSYGTCSEWLYTQVILDICEWGKITL